MGRNTPNGRFRGTTRDLNQAARQLRRWQTPAEAILWRALRRRQLHGLAFRRQHPVGPFVLDFYCPLYRLVVELDGGVHEQQFAQDAFRTEQLSSYGYRVLRFRNDEVFSDLRSVLARIVDATTATTPEIVVDESPSPALGGGVGEGANLGTAHKNRSIDRQQSPTSTGVATS